MSGAFPPDVILPALLISAAREAPELDLGPAISPLGEVRDVHGGVSLRGRLHKGGIWIDVIGIARYVWTRGEAVRAVAEQGVTEASIADQYLRGVIPQLLQVQGVQSLHAAAVVAGGGVIALCGTSGAGKSTTAAGLARRGFAPWGDDIVSFWLEGSAVQSPKLPFSFRLLPDAHAVLARPTNEEGAAIKEPPRRRLVGVIELRRHEGCPTLDRLEPAEALTTVLEHAYCLSLDPLDLRRRLTETYLGLVTAVPIWRLSFPPGLDQLPAVLDVLVAHLEGIDRSGT